MTKLAPPIDYEFQLNRAIFQLSGPDSVRYLNGQITQDVSTASHTQAVYSAITTAKGKMEGDLYVRRYEDTLLIDTPIELREHLSDRIQKYIIADDVEFSDITEDVALSHNFSNQNSGWNCHRFGIPGTDLLHTRAIHTKLPVADTQILETLRIQARIPKWGAELDSSTLPPEARLEERAISYNKGCYIGQEVISRIRSANKTNRLLELFELSPSISEPCDFFVATEPKPAGEITSICHTDGKTLGLGYLRRKHSDQSSFTTVAGSITKISPVT